MAAAQPNILLRNAIFSGRGDSVLQVLEALGEDAVRVVNERDCRTGSTALHYASYVKNAQVVHLLLQARANPALANFAGETALHVAAARNCPEAVDILLNFGCDPGYLSECLQTPLHSCAIYNSVKCAIRLIGVMDEIETFDINAMTPLHHAAFHGNADMVKLLLERQIDQDVYDRNGSTPLHLACYANSASVVKVLFRGNADMTAKDMQGRNCCHYLMLSREKDVHSVTKILQRVTVDLPWAKDHLGNYPIHYALHTNKVKAAKALLKWTSSQLFGSTLQEMCKYAASVDPIGELFNHFVAFGRSGGWNPLIADPGDFTVLHYACEWGREDRVNVLLELEFMSPNEVGPKEVTPLHCAVISGKESVVEMLLLEDVEINNKTTDGLTPLHVACAQPFPHIANLLIVNGAEVQVADSQGRTPLMLLANSQIDGDVVIELMEIIIEQGAYLNSADEAGWTALHYAAARGNTRMVDCLLERGADPAILDKHRRTALHYAAQATNGMAIAQALLKAKPQLHQGRDDRGLMAVHFAALSGATDLTIKLLGLMEKNQHLPLSAKPYHLTPLHLAVLRGKVEVVNAILAWGKSISPDRVHNYLTAIDTSRRIPLHYAMKYDYYDMLPALCPAEMCPLLLGWQDNDGITPLTMAAGKGNSKCVSYALEVLKDDAATVIRKTDSKKRCCVMYAMTAVGNGDKLFVTQATAGRVDANKRGMLHRAAAAKRIQLLMQLVKLQPDQVSAKDVNGVTPLHLSFAVGDAGGAQILLQAGADPVARNRNGATPADFAAANGKRSVMDYLLHEHYSNGVPRVPGLFTSIGICMAARNGHAKCANAILLEYPEFAKSSDPHKRTPLHLFAANGSTSVVKYLLECGADVDAEDEDGRIPLQMAAACGDGVGCIDLLADNESDLKHTDAHRDTALHIACSNGNTENAKALFRHILEFEDNEVIGMKNNDGNTVLHLSIKTGMKDFLVEVLPLSTHLLFEKDNEGRIPLCAGVSDPKVVETMMMMVAALVEDGNTTANDTIGSTLNRSAQDASPHSNRSSTPDKKSPSPSKGSPQADAQDEEY